MDASDRRISLNVRVDGSKMQTLESLRQTGFGLAQTQRNRSDVYNEVLGYGLQVILLRNEIGERDFERLWRLLHKVNLQKINLEKLDKLMS